MAKKDKVTSQSVNEIAELKPHEHLCQFYSTPEEWKAVVTSLLVTGLRRGERCIYITDTTTTHELHTVLQEQGVDVTAAEGSGQLAVLHESDFYTRGGFFDPDRVISLIITKTEAAIAEGYHALRVAGEMNWVFRGKPGSSRWLEYEARLNTDFFPKYPVTCICQYEFQRLSPPLLLNVLSAHHTILIGTKIYDNPYYITNTDLLSSKYSLEELQHWMESLGKLKEAEEQERR
jgi:hypothetical protein